MKPLNRSEGPLLARAVVSPLPAEEIWAHAQPTLEEMDVVLRYSKTLRCLKASYGAVGSGDECKFFLRMSNLMTPRGSNSTYLHWEYRAGSTDEFLRLFTDFCRRVDGKLPFSVGEDTDDSSSSKDTTSSSSKDTR